MSKVSEALQSLKNAIYEEGINPIEGLPLDLFEFSTTLLPFVNVDLLIQNSKGQILLSWRDDHHYGTGWQIPGGIIRMMETIDERIQKTSIREIGCKVSYEIEPILVNENIIKDYRNGLENQLERAHNIALLYRCQVPDDYEINNNNHSESSEGYLKWFDKFPDDLLECHKSLKNNPIMKEYF